MVERITADDLISASMDGLISSMPGIGALLLEYIKIPENKRKAHFLVKLNERITKLEQVMTRDNLIENPLFISTVFYAANIAIRNAQKEKIDCLLNAIENTGTNKLNLDDNVHFIFLNYIDKLTPLHFKLLYFLNKNDISGELGITLRLQTAMVNTNLHEVILCNFNELSNDSVLLDKLILDLYNDGLTNLDVNQSHSSISIWDDKAHYATSLGANFISFISV